MTQAPACLKLDLTSTSDGASGSDVDSRTRGDEEAWEDDFRAEEGEVPGNQINEV